MYVAKRAVDFRDLELITREQVFEETNNQECNNLIGLMNIVGTSMGAAFCWFSGHAKPKITGSHFP